MYWLVDMNPEEMDYHDLKLHVQNLSKVLSVKAEEYWRNAGYETIYLNTHEENEMTEYDRLVIENDELKKRLFDAVRMIKNPNISNFGLRLKRVEDCLQEENYMEVKSVKALIKKNAILECIDVAWNAPEPDGGDVAHRIADAMGYLIVEGDEGITLENRE